MSAYINQVLMNKREEVITIGQEKSVYDAIKVMCDEQIGSLPVVDDDGKLIGIFSERDCFTKVVLEDKPARDVKIGDVMAKEVISVPLEMPVDVCMALMTKERIRHVPVLDKTKKLVGIISIGDLVKSVVTKHESTIRSLEKYIEGSL